MPLKKQLNDGLNTLIERFGEEVYSSINRNEPLREMFVAMQAKYTSRRYAVMCSGYGSKFRFDGYNKDKPPFPLMTLDEAIADAIFFDRQWSNIGLISQIYDARKRKIVMHYVDIPWHKADESGAVRTAYLKLEVDHGKKMRKLIEE